MCTPAVGPADIRITVFVARLRAKYIFSVFFPILVKIIFGPLNDISGYTAA